MSRFINVCLYCCSNPVAELSPSSPSASEDRHDAEEPSVTEDMDVAKKAKPSVDQTNCSGTKKKKKKRKKKKKDKLE